MRVEARSSVLEPRHATQKLAWSDRGPEWRRSVAHPGIKPGRHVFDVLHGDERVKTGLPGLASLAPCSWEPRCWRRSHRRCLPRRRSIDPSAKLKLGKLQVEASHLLALGVDEQRSHA